MVEWSGILSAVGFALALERGMRSLGWVLLCHAAIFLTTPRSPAWKLADIIADYVVIAVTLVLFRWFSRGRNERDWRLVFRSGTLAFLIGSLAGGLAFQMLQVLLEWIFPGILAPIGWLDGLSHACHSFFALMTFVPAMLLSGATRSDESLRVPREQRGELLAWLFTGGLVLGGLFSGMLSLQTAASIRPGLRIEEYFPLVFLLTPTLLWGAIRFSCRLHAVALAAFLLVFYAGADIGLGPIGQLPPIHRKLYIALIGSVFSLLGQFINGLVWEGKAVALRLAEDVRRRERAVRDSERLLSSVIENIPDMIIVKEAATLKWVRINRAVEEQMGVGRSSSCGKTDWEILAPEAARLNEKRDREVIVSAEGISESVSASSSQSGIEVSEGDCFERSGQPAERRMCRVTRVPIPGGGSRPGYLLVIVKDITEARRAEDDRLRLAEESAARREAEKLLELRESFLSLVAHELRTPVSVVRLGLELIERFLFSGPGSSAVAGIADADRLKLLLNQSIHEIERLGRLVDNLLDVSRIESDHFEVSPRPAVDLSALAEEVVDLVRPVLRNAQCEVESRIAPGVFADADPDRIRQVFQNLLINASKFGRGKRVEIELSRTGDAWAFCVRDHGIGISPEAASKLFERFERGVSYREFPGLGLGLYISNRIVQAHGGTISVESVPGEGAAFTVRIPSRMAAEARRA